MWQTIKDFITKLVERIKKAYNGLSPDSVEGGLVADMTDSLQKLYDLWTDALADAGKKYSALADVGIGFDSGVMYSPRENVLSWDIAWDSNNYSSIKEQLVAHLDDVNSMQPVTSVNYNKEDGKPYYEQLDEILRTKFGYKIERQDHGSINFDPKGISGIRKYVYTDAEAAAVIASPYVLKRGKAISGHKNHKDNGHPSVVYAAPVTINGKVGNVAVSVLYGSARRVHSVRVLTPSGKEFILAEIKDTEPKNGGSVTKSAVEPPISSVSKDRIAQNSNSVNMDAENNLYSDTRYSFRSSESGTANDALSPYSEELTRFIKQKGDYIVDSFEKLEQIVDLAFNNTSNKATAYFGIINLETLEKIKSSIPNLPKAIEGILFKEGRDYSIATTLDAIRHIVDDKSLSREDVIDYLDRFADTILEFDSVSFDYYTDSYNNKIPGLLFKKMFDDGTLVSFDLVSNKKRSIVLQTLYMDSADYQKKKSAETLLMKNNLSHTPKARVGQTSINSISQDTDSVNRKMHEGHKDKVKYSDRDYSYDELVAKDDVKGNLITKEQQVEITPNGIIDLEKLVKHVRESCSSLTTKSAEPTYYIGVADIGRNVEITRDGIIHGIARKNKLNKHGNLPESVLINARATLGLANILANSIEVNRASRGQNIDVPYTHVMLGVTAMEDRNGGIEYYAVRSMIQERVNQNPILVEANVLGKLYAVNAKKIDPSYAQDTMQNSGAFATKHLFQYSVAHLLEDVKSQFDDTLSLDVYTELGATRKVNDFSKDLLYSDRSPNSVSNRTLLANVLESVAQNDIERKKLAQYKDKISLIEAEQTKLAEIRSKIKELSFAKGKRDTAKIKELQFEANKTANRINTYDRQILNLESTAALKGVLEREKQMAYQKAKKEGKEALEAYRESCQGTT